MTTATTAPAKVSPWKNIGHFFASVLQKTLALLGVIAKDTPIIEAVTAEIPVYGPLLLTAEKGAFAVAGEIAAFLHAGGDAAEAKLLNLGLDANVVATAKALGQGVMAAVATAMPAAAPSVPTGPAAPAGK